MQDYEVIDIQSDNWYICPLCFSIRLWSHYIPRSCQGFKEAKGHEWGNGSIEKNDSWELVEILKWQKFIGVKWVYKTKLNKDGGVYKYKARLVAKAYKQKFGMDYKYCLLQWQNLTLFT